MARAENAEEVAQITNRAPGVLVQEPKQGWLLTDQRGTTARWAECRNGALVERVTKVTQSDTEKMDTSDERKRAEQRAS